MDEAGLIGYRTGHDDLVQDFFVPCLEHAVLYRRARGERWKVWRPFHEFVETGRTALKARNCLAAASKFCNKFLERDSRNSAAWFIG